MSDPSSIEDFADYIVTHTPYNKLESEVKDQLRQDIVTRTNNLILYRIIEALPKKIQKQVDQQLNSETDQHITVFQTAIQKYLPHIQDIISSAVTDIQNYYLPSL